MKIIDAKTRLCTYEMLRHWTDELKPFFKDYIKLYKMESRLYAKPIEEYLKYVSQYNVEKVVVCSDFQEDNAYVLEKAKQYEKIIPVAYIDVNNGIVKAINEAEKSYRNGAVALYVAPYRNRIDLNDRKLYPIYGLSAFYNKPVIVYGSIHFWSESSMWHGQPSYVDDIATDFPELKIIVCHGGNGFGPSILAVAQRHVNVYLEFSGLNPKYMAPEFLYAANTYLKEKCLFGTDFPLTDLETEIIRWDKVLRDDVKHLFFYENVKKVFNI
jgi:predicted TIM-barrel fold metal-dependent hydrolase